MAYTITNLHIKAWEQQIRFLAQQTDARLRPWVQERVGAAASRSWSRMAALDFAAKGSRGTNTAVSTPISDSQYSGRVATVASYCSGDLIEQDEIEQVAIDPQAAVLYRLAAGARRYFDKIIIAAATAAAPDDAGSTTAFTAGQTVGDYTGEFKFDLVTEVNEKFLSNNVDPTEPKVFVIGPKMARALMHETKATSVDFVNAQALVGGGFVKDWMGFTWIVSNLLNAPAAGQLDCLAFTKRALGLSIAKDIHVESAVDPSASFAHRIYSEFTAGAVRVEDEQIVKVAVLDQFTPPA